MRFSAVEDWTYFVAWFDKEAAKGLLSTKSK